MNTSQIPLDEFKKVRDQLVIILDDLATVADERDAEEIVWQERKEVRQKMASGLRERAMNVAHKETFKLAVVGEYNAGKSTFINALLGREILSTAWKPDTATKTVLTYGEPERFIIVYRPYANIMPEEHLSHDLKEDLAKYTSDSTAFADDTERLNNDDATLSKKIQEVDVWCLADFLQKREIDIVDTPGLGSVFSWHKQVTYGLVPQVDATMFLFPIDPGIGDEDVLFLRYMREHIKQIFFVMTKSDHERKAEVRQERARFNWQTIQVRAGFKEEEMRPVYPVSAETELAEPNRYPSESGFPEVVEALIDFLVSSSGVARLDAPLEYARQKQKTLLEETQRDIENTDRDLESLRDELFHLESEQKHIETAKKEILSDIKDTIEEMKEHATDGIEGLPANLQHKVEAAIDSYDRKQLKNINNLLEVVIKEEVSAWVNHKTEKFESEQKRLQQRIDREMRNIVEHLMTIESQSANRGVSEVEVPTSKKLFTNAAWSVRGKMAVKAALVGGSAGGVMLGTILIGAIAGVVVLPIALIVGLPIAAAITAIGGDSLSLTKRTREKLKEDLRKPQPQSGLTVYRLVVKGGHTENGFQPGLEKTMKDTFMNWGQELQNQVENWVANQIDSRLTQLRRIINEKQSGRFNREHNLKRCQEEIITLQDLDRQLVKVETTVQNMRQGKYSDADENASPDADGKASSDTSEAA